MNITISRKTNPMMKIVKENKNAVDIVVDFLSNGKLVFMATETVYIAAVDATNPRAVLKLISFKNRPSTSGLRYGKNMLF